MSDSDMPTFGGFPAVIVQTGFEMHILYQPASPGSSDIPMSRLLWTWNASGPSATEGQPDGTAVDVRSIGFPEWDQRLGNLAPLRWPDEA